MNVFLFRALAVDRFIDLLKNERCLATNQIDLMCSLLDEWSDIQEEGGLSDETKEALFSAVPLILFCEGPEISKSNIRTFQNFLHIYINFLDNLLFRYENLLNPNFDLPKEEFPF